MLKENENIKDKIKQEKGFRLTGSFLDLLLGSPKGLHVWPFLFLWNLRGKLALAYTDQQDKGKNIK